MKIAVRLILISILFVSINSINATVLKSEKIITKPFTNIEIDGAFTVILNQGNKENVLIESESSMMPYIKSSVKNNTLKIKLKTGPRNKNIAEIKLYITIKDLKNLKLSGFINLITLKQINHKELNLSCYGSVNAELNSSTNVLNCSMSSFSKIKLIGDTDHLHIKKTAASSIHAFKLKANAVNINSSGFGKVNVSVVNSLSVKSKGATAIRYHGNPKVKQIDVKGFSTLKKEK